MPGIFRRQESSFPVTEVTRQPFLGAPPVTGEIVGRDPRVETRQETIRGAPPIVNFASIFGAGLAGGGQAAQRQAEFLANRPQQLRSLAQGEASQRSEAVLAEERLRQGKRRLGLSEKQLELAQRREDRVSKFQNLSFIPDQVSGAITVIDREKLADLDIQPGQQLDIKNLPGAFVINPRQATSTSPEQLVQALDSRFKLELDEREKAFLVAATEQARSTGRLDPVTSAFRTLAVQQQNLDRLLLRMSSKTSPTTSEINDFADAVLSGEIEVTNVPGSLRGKVIQAIRNQGGKIIPRKVREQEQEFDSAQVVLDELINLIQQIQATPFFSTERAALTEIYSSRRRAFVATMARASGEKGRLSDQDAARALANTSSPLTVSVAPGFALRKIQGAKTIFDEIRKRKSGRSLGRRERNQKDILQDIKDLQKQ